MPGSLSKWVPPVLSFELGLQKDVGITWIINWELHSPLVRFLKEAYSRVFFQGQGEKSTEEHSTGLHLKG